jgi:hypothetical protein
VGGWETDSFPLSAAHLPAPLWPVSRAASFDRHDFHEDQHAMTHPDQVDPPDDPADEFQQILVHFHEQEQARLNDAKAKLRDDILPAFIQHRVANIEAVYSGYGDSGCIDGTQYRDAAGMRVDRASIPRHMIERLETLLYEFLPAGFEINDGSQGTLTIDTRTAKVTIQHQENYTASNDSTREFDL